MTVDYQPTADQRTDRRRRRLKRLNAALVVLAALAVTAGLLAMVEVRTDMAWVDARSGTYHRQTIWTFGYEGRRVETASPFAHRLAQLGVTWEPDWRNIQGDGRNIYGRTITRGHGAAPPVYELMKLRVDQLNDDDIRRINQILSGADPTIGDDEDEQKRAIHAILDIALFRC